MEYSDFRKIDEDFFSTILDEDFKFEGTIIFDDSLIIKGTVKGKIETKGDLIIGPKAVIEANIKSKNLHCYGIINGNIEIKEEAYFHDSAIQKGSITSKLLTIERGSKISGLVRMDLTNS